MIPDAVLNQIQDRVDIVELVSKYVPLKKAGRNFKGNCPFHHEKTPSFMVSPDKQIFHCFGCGAGGNVFSFLMKTEKQDFREAVETLADSVGIEIPKDKTLSTEQLERSALFLKANQLALDFYHDVLLKRKEAAKAKGYLEKRGILEKTIDEFKLGYALESWDELIRAVKGKVPEAVLEKVGLILSKKDGGFYDRFRHRIIFPILDAKGACLGFGGRVLDDSLPKYLNSPESEIYSKGRHLYGLFQARKAVRDTDQVIVVEGYMDLIACHQAGVQNVVASLGTALTNEQVRLIKRHTKNVFILYDADKAGEMATLRGLELFLEEGLEVKIVRLSTGHDPDAFIQQFGVEKFRQELGKAKTLFDFRLTLLKTQFDAKSLEGKVKIANEMVLLLAKVPNEILRNAWLKELARELSLSEEALLSEMKKGGSRFRNIPAAAVSAPRAESVLNSAEKFLIGLLLENPDWVAGVTEEVRLEDFQNEKARQILSRIFSRESAALSAAQFINLYKDDPEGARIVATACAESDTVVDKQKTLSDCLSWMKRLKAVQERENLTAEIAVAQRLGDKNRINQLLVNFNELNKGIRRINEKK